jgi:hypothetical protein
MARKVADPLIVQFDKHDVYAIQALRDGKANEGQQKRCLDLIIRNLSGTYDQSYRPGGPEAERATAFAEGRRFVGLKLVLMVNMTAAMAEKLGTPNG